MDKIDSLNMMQCAAFYDLRFWHQAPPVSHTSTLLHDTHEAV
jgi:hypothetical protein